MIDALIAGRLYGHAEERSGQSNSTFVTCRVRATAGDGDTIFVNVITFADDVMRILLSMDDGDSIALSGALTPKCWTDKHGDARPALDLVAHAVLTAFHVTHRRKAVHGQDSSANVVCGDDFFDTMP